MKIIISRSGLDAKFGGITIFQLKMNKAAHFNSSCRPPAMYKSTSCVAKALRIRSKSYFQEKKKENKQKHIF